MALFRGNERAFLEAASRLAYCNPFLAERIEFEREALGDEFIQTRAAWNIHPGEEAVPNVVRLTARAEELAQRLRQRLAEGCPAEPAELVLYEDLVLLVLYHRYLSEFHQTINRVMASRGARPGKIAFYSRFLRDAQQFLDLPGVRLPSWEEIPHVFACFFQIRRAFFHVFRHLIGVSAPAIRLRAAVWQSIFSHDMRRYRRTLYNRMGDLTTLIVGPSGTGKELVARAIGLSRYIPFNPETQSFTEDFAGSFHALNLSALSPTLIESELFGHHRGAFTGAVGDRAGWLEVCPPLGTVFLDEIGELDGAIQVKLLRVLQSRTFQRIGDTQTREFQGKIIAATNRDLAREIRAGRFREDFYYRICSDVIVTPSLLQQVQDNPQEMHNLVLFLARRIVGEEEAPILTAEVEQWIARHLPADYPWAGNVRELEQCVRNVLIRKSYQPAPRLREAADPAEALVDALRAGNLSAEELLGAYCQMIYEQTGSYVETARRLGLDRRTVKDKIEYAMTQRGGALGLERAGGNGHNGHQGQD